jgi:alpha-galactosidase
LGNKQVIRVDQDPLGRMATLVQRTPASDILLKPLADGDYAVAAFNHSDSIIHVRVPLALLGFSSVKGCSVLARNLWTGMILRHQHKLEANVKPHDTIIWRLHPASSCRIPSRTGAIVMTVPGSRHNPDSRTIDSYGRCLSSTGFVQRCQGNKEELWTISDNGLLHAGNRCLGVKDGVPEMEPCTGKPAQQWVYKQNGNLVNANDHLCLSIRGTNTEDNRHWEMQPCGHNEATQIWALPNKQGFTHL